jgi:hypothetical protein
MKWEDLERVRAERVAKEKAAADKGKGKRGRKGKVCAREVDGAVEGDAQEVGRSAPVVKSKKEKRKRVQRPDPKAIEGICGANVLIS